MKKLFSLIALMMVAGGIALPAHAQEAIRLSHSVINDTKSYSSEVKQASREDFLTYTLSITNAGSTTLAYAPTFDAAGILPLADIVDPGGGALNGQTISYPTLTLSPGQTVEEMFRVRVKAFLPGYQYVIQSTFGNTQRVIIEALGSAAQSKQAPKTGSMDIYPWVLGLILAGGYGMIKKIKAS